MGYKESVIQKEIDDLKKQEENERTVNDRVLNFLKGRTTDYSRKGESWDQTNDQEQTRLDNEIRDISDERERIKDELERVQAKLKEEQEKERLRLEKEEKERQDKIDEEKRLVEMEAAIKWIQKKLVALHPFKPSKKKGKGMMGKMGKKK